MSLMGFCGKVALGFSCLIVLISIFFFLLLGACVILGGCESVTNPHALEDARAEYQNVTAEIAAGTSEMEQAVMNVTGGYKNETL